MDRTLTSGVLIALGWCLPVAVYSYGLDHRFITLHGGKGVHWIYLAVVAMLICCAAGVRLLRPELRATEGGHRIVYGIGRVGLGLSLAVSVLWLPAVIMSRSA